MLSIIAPGKPLTPWLKALKDIAPDLSISVWPEIDPATKMVLCWKAPEQCFDDLPDLGCICSMGAGVDHILEMTTRPPNIPVVRLVDPLMNEEMFDYIYQCLERYRLNISTYEEHKDQRQWLPAAYKKRAEMNVCILGLGQIGHHVAIRLKQAGYQVRGWRRTAAEIEGIETFSCPSIAQAVSGCHAVVNLLPLTPDTKDLLNKTLFAQLADDSCLINVARGEHLVEDDLLAAVDSGKVQEAFLDVFRVEPLPPGHPFWTKDSIHITPHIASLTNPDSVAEQILDNYHRLISDEPLQNQVNIELGY